MEKIKLGIIGTRGIPAKYGGFETFAQEISPLLVRKGIDVTVYCDNTDSVKKQKTYKGVNLRYLKTTKTKSPLKFYFDSLRLAINEQNIILVTGTAGSLFYFLNIFKRKIIITNTDGVESRRAKWSLLKRYIIKLTENLSAKFSTHLIADSKGISKYLSNSYPKLKREKISTIEYGAEINNKENETILRKYKLEKNKYYLVVSRLEPENNIKMIIDGYILNNSEKPLIIVGNLLNNEYIESLLSNKYENIRFVGGIYNQEELSVLRYAAYAYIHGHSVGGTNPSLLEALGSSNICICHDNIFNREVTDNSMFYFNTNKELAKQIELVENLNQTELEELKRIALHRIIDYYNWENIAKKYYYLFKKLYNE